MSPAAMSGFGTNSSLILVKLNTDYTIVQNGHNKLHMVIIIWLEAYARFKKQSLQP